MASMSPALQEMLKKAKTKYANNTGKTVKLKEGKTRVRILQKSETDKFWADLAVHWIKADKNGKPMAVVGCVDVIKDEPCVVCQAIETAVAAAVDDESLEIIKSWKARKSILVNALIRDGADASEEPQILEMTSSTFGAILTIMEEYGAELGNILDAKDGIDFIIERRGKGLDTEYTVMPAAKSKPVDKTVLDRMHDLDAYIEANYLRGEEQKALRAIAQITGISSIAGSPKMALSGSKGDMDFERLPPPRTTTVKRPAAPPVAETTTLDEDEIPFDDAEVLPPPAKKATVVVKPAAATSRVIEKEPVGEPPANFGEALDDDDLDALLDELDEIK